MRRWQCVYFIFCLALGTALVIMGGAKFLQGVGNYWSSLLLGMAMYCQGAYVLMKERKEKRTSR